MNGIVSCKHNYWGLHNDNYAELFRFVNDGLSVLDLTEAPVGKYLEVNDVFCNMLEYSRDELIGHSPVEISSGEFSGELRQFIQELRSGCKGNNTKEIVFKAKGGRCITTELSVHVVETNNRLLGFGIHHDITRRKQVEQELRLAYEKESQLRCELESLNNKRIEFARALVHEIKTSLTPIMCSIKVLTTMASDETAHLLTQNISRAASTLDHRIDEHYDLIRGEVGTLDLVYSWINPSEILEEIYLEFCTRASINKKRFIKDIESHIPPIWADDDRLKQIIENLLDNADKYTPEGSTIMLKAKQSDSTLFISVEDTGPGIPRRARSHVFRSYYRLSSSAKKAGGLGLGLALCKHLVELHGGKISIHGNKPQGCIVNVSIPYTA
ncbi:PAS domain-containing sensor histidine kinase [Dehalogenimonas alkenigignens]|uniref:PAS domain-containing sensor histidine kinase n=1 Tax=Dehalogenimonas alkenigignens TaxID=1217799 RepID=UPI0014037A9B|nr:PAS domain-containing sensor histidine kinase [Dehalogenimonas alkenigignens]